MRYRSENVRPWPLADNSAKPNKAAFFFYVFSAPSSTTRLGSTAK